MKVVVITGHKYVYSGNTFSIFHCIEHTEGKIDPTVANSDRAGDGLSENDKRDLFEYLRDLGNIHSISVNLYH